MWRIYDYPADVLSLETSDPTFERYRRLMIHEPNECDDGRISRWPQERFEPPGDHAVGAVLRSRVCRRHLRHTAPYAASAVASVGNSRSAPIESTSPYPCRSSSRSCLTRARAKATPLPVSVDRTASRAVQTRDVDLHYRCHIEHEQATAPSCWSTASTASTATAPRALVAAEISSG